MARAALRLALVSLAAAGLRLSPAAAQPSEDTAALDGDFSPRFEAWNSVSTMIRIARDRGVPIAIPSRLDIGTLTPADSLLILSPREAPPTTELTGFLRAGGRAALADDFGEGLELLQVFDIGRGAPSGELAMRLRGNPALLVARPRGAHRLSRGVTALVSNHPAIVYHQGLSPVFALGEGEALVLAGAVGPGRFVVLSDPSVLIDNMLQLRGNRRFAENLVDYLAAGRGGTLYVIGPHARIAGRFGEPGADRPLHDLRRALETVAELDVPPPALRIASLALAAIAVILALGVLPRRSPYRSSRMFARPAAQGGFAGRVQFFSRPKVNLLQPLMVYKFELEEEILRRLSLRGRALLRDVLGAMRARGMPDADQQAMRALLLELDRLHRAAEQPPAPPHVGSRRFRELVSTGDALLERLGPPRAGAREAA